MYKSTIYCLGASLTILHCALLSPPAVKLWEYRPRRPGLVTTMVVVVLVFLSFLLPKLPNPAFLFLPFHAQPSSPPSFSLWTLRQNVAMLKYSNYHQLIFVFSLLTEAPHPYSSHPMLAFLADLHWPVCSALVCPPPGEGLPDLWELEVKDRQVCSCVCGEYCWACGHIV